MTTLPRPYRYHCVACDRDKERVLTSGDGERSVCIDCIIDFFAGYGAPANTVAIHLSPQALVEALKHSDAPLRPEASS